VVPSEVQCISNGRHNSCSKALGVSAAAVATAHRLMGATPCIDRNRQIEAGRPHLIQQERTSPAGHVRLMRVLVIHGGARKNRS
jgi:hypothetical protein